ncbi:MAG: pitrilysin family protein [Patescibacteria group bacterium]|jgi:predicted Zn-dependent peptidase
MMPAKTLKNGMRVHLIPMLGTSATTVMVLVHTGSRHEQEGIFGGAHFVEHMSFKGTKKYPRTKDISSLLDRYGAQYNAFTGKDITAYYIKIENTKTKLAIDLLHEMLFESLYRTKDIEQERGVILEELKMYEENPMMHVDDLLERALFRGTKLGNDIIGTRASLLGMNRASLLHFHKTHYVPANMAIVVSGALPASTFKDLEKTFGSVSLKNKVEDIEELSLEVYGRSKTPRIERQFKKLEQIQLGIAFPTFGRDHKFVPALAMLSYILGGSMSSRLFLEVREKRGLCYFIRAEADGFKDIGSLTIRAGLDEKRLAEALKVIFGEIQKIKKTGVTAEELAFAKDHVEGAMKLAFEDSYQQAEFIGRQEIALEKVKDMEEKIKELRAVSAKEIQDVAKEILNLERLSLAVVGPYKTDVALRTHLPVIE